MPAISHVKSNTIADWGAGAVTVYNSAGSTTTVNATDLVRPGDWNSVHNQTWTISGNTAGDASTHSGTNLVFGGTGPCTLNMSTAAGAATVWVSAPNDNPMSEYEPISGSAIQTNSSLGQNSLYFVPFYLEDEVYISRVNFFVSVATTCAAANSTGNAGFTLSAALYSRMTAAGSNDRMSRLWSNTFALSATMNSNTQFAITNVVGISDSQSVSTAGTSISDANGSTYLRDSVAGYRVWALPVNTTLGVNRYWLAVANSSSSSNATLVLGANVGVQTVGGVSALAYQRVGTSSSGANISYNAGAWGGGGTYSATSNAFPASIPLTSDSIRNGGTFTFPYFNFSGHATTNSIL